MDEPRPQPLSYASPQSRQARRSVPGLVGRLLSGLLVFVGGAVMAFSVVAELFMRLAGRSRPLEWGWMITFGLVSLVFIIGGLFEVRSAIAQLRESP